MLNPELNIRRNAMWEKFDKVKEAVEELMIAVKSCEELGISVRPSLSSELDGLIVDFAYPPEKH